MYLSRLTPAFFIVKNVLQKILKISGQLFKNNSKKLAQRITMYYLYFIKQTQKPNAMKTIQTNQTITARSICDSECIFKLTVIERKGNFATINYDGWVKRTKVYVDFEGNEYLMPQKYSMAPIFKAIN